MLPYVYGAALEVGTGSRENNACAAYRLAAMVIVGRLLSIIGGLYICVVL